MTSQDKATSRAESGEALKSMESMMRPETVVQAKKEAAEILAESAPGWELWDAIDALPMVDGRVELGAVQKILLASRPAESGKTVPMEMLLAFRSYGRSMPEDTKRALLIEIAARYGYTVTEDKEEGR